MTKRLQVEMDDRDYETLRQIAGKRTISELVRRAINTEAILDKAEAEGSEILLRRDGQEPTRLVRL